MCSHLSLPVEDGFQESRLFLFFSFEKYKQVFWISYRLSHPLFWLFYWLLWILDFFFLLCLYIDICVLMHTSVCMHMCTCIYVLYEVKMECIEVYVDHESKDHDKTEGGMLFKYSSRNNIHP